MMSGTINLKKYGICILKIVAKYIVEGKCGQYFDRGNTSSPAQTK